MIKENGEVMDRKISWIIISFDNDKTNVLLVSKYMIQ